MQQVWKNFTPALALVIGLALPLFAQEYTVEKLTPELQAELEAAPDAYHDAYLLLADRIDVRAMENDFRRRRASIEARSYELITALQEKAAATQPALLERLNGMPGVDIRSLKPLWITNVIYLRAKAEALLLLSRDPAVEELGLDAEVTLETADAGTAAPALTTNRERGLEVIGAPQMWAMGYTGYGRKALIIDTGQDPTHPALYRQFAYHNRPLSQAWDGGEDIQDCGSHGSHVTGIILGLDRMARDTIGVAFNAEWLGGIGLGGSCNGGVSTAGINSMLQWAVDPDGNPATVDDRPDVINNSWASGSPGCSSPNIFGVYNALYAAGIAVIFSAGNDGPGSATITPPKMYNWDLVRLFAVGNLNGNSSTLPISASSSRGPSICGGQESLHIKPEVSAPGTSVRSSVPNGGYGNKSGTSMASPHVAGAVLLLKEAFPYLTGEEIMLALYFSCVDLGDPGEDNTYGMGLIDVPAAYQYLIDQGYEPEAPASAANDVSLLRLGVPDFNCGAKVEPTVELENSGTETVTSLQFTYAILNGSGTQRQHDWTGSLLPGERLSLELPSLTYGPGEYELVVAVSQVNGTEDIRNLDNQLKEKITLLTEDKIAADVVGDGPACSNRQVLVKSSFEGDGDITWYDAPEGGNIIGFGAGTLIEMGEAPQTVYAEVALRKNVGKADQNAGTSQFSNGAFGLIFDAMSSFTLRSVKVIAEEAGNRFIRLNLSDGTVYNKIVPIEAGEQRIQLDFPIKPGNGHRITLQGGGPLQFNYGGNAYPYEIPNLMAIRRSTGSTLQYYYFYDWKVEYESVCGRTAVDIDVVAADDAPIAAFEPVATEVDLATDESSLSFMALSPGATFWLWDFGDGATSTEQNPVHDYAEPGAYTVFLTVTGAEGCSSSTSGTVTVVNSGVVNSLTEVTEAFSLHAFPNPAQDRLFLQFGLEQPVAADIWLLDMLGRPVLMQQIQAIGGKVQEISLAGLPAGTYILVAGTEEGRVAQRVVKSR